MTATSVTDTFPVGATVRVAGRRGTFKVRRRYPNGDVLLWGGTAMREAFRVVTADKLRAAK